VFGRCAIVHSQSARLENPSVNLETTLRYSLGTKGVFIKQFEAFFGWLSLVSARLSFVNPPESWGGLLVKSQRFYEQSGA
jgi:hypothetical protein